ncbi:hypothetical protein IJH29_02120 [Candidatus Saccharibacteria bacterium]|nr:hypothetical protein [Candidatus Saccharibacteria bacterium]
MLVSASRLIGYPVLSLHVGGAIAWTTEEIVEPESLKIIGFYVDGPIIKNDPEVGDILDTRDVREFSNLGMIVNSEDVFTREGEVKKIDQTLELEFSLIGLKVETKKGSKLGKIVDYTVNTDNFSVQQLIVKRPTLKALVDPELVVPRREIVEITDYKVIVKDEEAKIKKVATKEDFIPNFVNPFREPDFSTSRARKTKIPQ